MTQIITRSHRRSLSDVCLLRVMYFDHAPIHQFEHPAAERNCATANEGESFDEQNQAAGVVAKINESRHRCFRNPFYRILAGSVWAAARLSARISRRGGSPNIRVYSRLNCERLS
jgi:hypothetical protein